MNTSGLYKVGIYIRLSREDDDKDSESESITNQRSLLLQYVRENNYNLFDIYIDDGYSGTNFNRPAFKRLIADINTGKINMVITKDMSRLGRDYIGTGNLIEKYFPEHEVRYIAVTDNIDTFTDSACNDIAPFKAIMNDMYAKDISKKIRSSLLAKQKEGKWVSGRTPFGYEHDPENRHHLIINYDQASVVKRIFSMCLEGLTYYKIADRLTRERVKTPAEYYDFEWHKHYNLHYGIWHAKTIQDILTNRIYIGDLVQNKRRKVNYKIKKVIKNPSSDYIIKENTHEAIIDRDTFYDVQRRLPKNVGRCEKKENYLLDGLLYCGDCGHRISVSTRKRNNCCYTLCNYYRTYTKLKLCTTHSNNYDKLEKNIISILRNEIIKHISLEYIKNNIKLDSFNDIYLENNNNLRRLNEELNNLTMQIDSSYIDKLNGIIDEKQFIRIKDMLDREISYKTKQIDSFNSQLSDKNTINKVDIDKLIDDYINMNTISREMVVELIDKIEIFENKTINIIVSFTL